MRTLPRSRELAPERAADKGLKFLRSCRMLIIGLALAALQASGAVAPPADDDFRSALTAKAPNIEVASIEVQSSSGGGTACGTARIGGAIEPFAVVFRKNDPAKISVVTLTMPDGTVVHSRPSDGPWRINVMAPYRATSDDLAMSAHARRQWDALDRRQALAFCPRLTPPEGAVWTTDIEPDPASTPGQQTRARRLAQRTTDLIFGTPQGSNTHR